MRKLLVFMLLLAGPAFASSTRSQRVFDSMFVTVGGVGFPGYTADPWTCDAFTLRAMYYNTTSNTIRYCNGTAWGAVGFTGGTITDNIFIDGSADEIQLQVQGVAGQTAELFVLENSAGANFLSVSNAGLLTIGSVSGAANSLDINQSGQIVFEGATSNAFQTFLQGADVGADATITLPSATTTLLGSGANTFTLPQMIDGTTDAAQLVVQGNAAQTSNLAVFENSATTDIITVGNGGAAVLGSNLCLTNCDFASNDMTGWTSSDISKWVGATGKAVHTAGVADTLIQAVTVVSGSVYEISFAFVAGGTSTMTVALGVPVTLSATYGTATYKVYLTAAATAAVNLTFTPAAAFSGSIDDVTVKLITSSVPSMTVLNSAGTVAAEVRGATGTGNVLIGDEAGGRITDATDNVAIGKNALASLGSGPNGNIAIGNGALAIFTGQAGSAYGVTGRNVAVGQDALAACGAACYSNVAVGPNAAAALGGHDSTAVGYNASAATHYSVAVGSGALAGSSTSTAIGYAANATGAYATVVGGSSTINGGNGGYNTILGGNSTISATGGPIGNTLLGSSATVAASVDYCIGLGAYSNCALDNSLVVGDDQANYHVANGYFGEGVTSTSAVADKSFTIQATGGSGADNVGGNFTVAGGASTGTGIGGSVYTATSPEAAGTASTLNALVTRSMVNAKTYAPADNTATTVLTITVPASSSCGGVLQYHAWAASASEIQSNVGQVSFGCIEDPDSATTACSANESGTELATVSAGTYTAAWSFAGAALQVTLDSSLDTASKLTYVVTMNSGCVLTP